MTRGPSQIPQTKDALRIGQKLHEHYIGTDEGYAGDWSDAKIAEALAVPRAWVVHCRRELFGIGAGDNEEIKTAVHEALKACEEAKSFRPIMEEIARRVEKVERTLIEIQDGMR